MMIRRIIAFCLLSCILKSASAQTMLDPQDMKYDLAVMKTTLDAIHPGLYRYNSKAQIDRYFINANAKVESALSLRSFFILLSQLNANIHCGHSYVSFYNNKKKIKEELYSNIFLPVLFRVIDRQFIITHDLTVDHSFTEGSEITAINGIPVNTIIDSLLTVSKADGINGLDKKLDNISIYKRDIGIKQYCLFDIYFPLFFKNNLNDDNFSLTVKKDLQESIINVKGISKEEREKRFTFKYGPVPKNEESWWLKELNSKTVYFKLGDFTTYNWKFDFKAYLDSVFIALNKKAYQHLIIDIRENEGGANDAVDAVLSYLTDKNINCSNPVRRLYRYISIPDSIKPYLNSWDEEFKKDKVGYTKTADGYYEKNFQAVNCDTILPAKNHFKGKVYLITDVTNSSASFIMADCVKRNKLGTIVGEKTGGTQQGINGGEIFFFYLPKSTIEMDLPLIWQRPMTDKPDEGIIPDVKIKTTVRDIATKTDPQLIYILTKLIK